MIRFQLITTAVIEIATGIALLAFPVQLVALLLGSPLDTPAGLAVARVAGAAILALGMACWFGSRDAQSRATLGIVAAMLFYNIAVAVLFIWLRFDAGMTGIGLIPAAAAHAALALWCIVCLKDFLVFEKVGKQT